jgi:hypothetical protein
MEVRRKMTRVGQLLQGRIHVTASGGCTKDERDRGD